ncbi:MAG: cobalt-precorrin-5B (C1)-methyltransferase [bacterium]|jgi:cobalt-precorrin-5B (C1)-methyltransferase
MSNQKKPFDLDKRADNGLRRGFTTGSCATAGVKAGLLKLLLDIEKEEVEVTLADQIHYLVIPIKFIEQNGDEVKVGITKYSGDDPDVTSGATITATVRKNDLSEIRFLADEGVGMITQQGFYTPVGEAAINPVPRQMMRQALEEVLSEYGEDPNQGFDFQIGCVDGKKIAKRTYNQRLGIEGGISILGTTGIVEPKSLSSYLASIELYIRIALAVNYDLVVFSPGNIGQKFAVSKLNLPLKRIIQMSNFIGFSLDFLNQSLGKSNSRLSQLMIAGHPGKLAKVLDGTWDTHSRKSNMAIATIAWMAEEFGFSKEKVEECSKAITVERIIQILKEEKEAPQFWKKVEQEIVQVIQTKTSNVDHVEVLLFGLDGNLLRGAL